jgi:hypothetical protein
VKKFNKLKFVVSALVLILVVAGAVFIQQKITYDAGSKSLIFGEKLSYAQHQMMPFNGLSFSVQKTKNIPFTPYAMAQCPGISEASSIALRCLQANDIRYTHNQAYRNKDVYQISLSARNTQSVVARLSNYSLSFDSNSVTVLARNIDTTDIIPGTSKAFSIQIRVPLATKNVNLLIENSGVTKYFKISL